jgi:small ligand-binding sensory domain FIST
MPAYFANRRGLRSGSAASEAVRNLLTKTQQFDNAAWIKFNSSVTADTTVAPDGTTTAETLQADFTSNSFAYQDYLDSTATTYTSSVYLKKGTGAFAYMILSDPGVGGRTVWLNMTTGALGTTHAGLTASVSNEANGFFRLVATHSELEDFIIGVSDADNTVNVTSGVTLILWGAQLELGGAVTAYQARN